MAMPDSHLDLFMERLRECGYTDPRTTTFVAIALRMNERNYKTFVGGVWTAERVRGFVRHYSRRKVRLDI